MIGSWEGLIAEACGENLVAYLKLVANMWHVDVRTFVEIGVYSGGLSARLRNHFPDAHLYLVDPWILYDDYLRQEAGPVCKEPALMQAAYQLVCKRFGTDPQVTILRQFSAQAASLVPDQLDFVYIDGNHAYESVKEDILMWMPKVRPGGILAGHDYKLDSFPGVVKAVNEIFENPPLIGTHNVWIWHKPSVLDNF